LSYHLSFSSFRITSTFSFFSICILFPSCLFSLLPFFLLILRLHTSPLFPTRRSSDLSLFAVCYGAQHLIDEVNPKLISYFDPVLDRKSTRLNSSHVSISYAVFCLKKKNIINFDTLYNNLQYIRTFTSFLSTFNVC